MVFYTLSDTRICIIPHTLSSQIALEKLEAYEDKDTQAENGQDHHIGEFLNRLDKCPYNDLES